MNSYPIPDMRPPQDALPAVDLRTRGDEPNIRAITRAEFDRLLPQNSALENLMVEQVEWFSNRSGTLLGTIARGESVAGWNYAILKLDRKGDPHARKVMNNFFSSKAARVDLLLSMAEIDRATRDGACFGSPWIPTGLPATNSDQHHGSQSETRSRSGRTSNQTA
jgi:hypothetical protein